MEIIQEGRTPNIGLGSIVFFPRYDTTYIVHVADRSAVEQYKTHDCDSYQLYRLDGRKPYRRLPFKGAELEALVENLGGIVYNANEFVLRVERRS